MKTKNEIIGIKRIVSKKTGKSWVIYYIDITDKDTAGVAVAPVWTQAGINFNIGDMIEVVRFNGRYFACL